MGLSCSCGEWEGDGWYWMRREKSSMPFYHQGKPVFDIEFFRPLWTKRNRKCKSCGLKIETGATCVEFERFRGCNNDIECRIYDETEGVPLASWFLCESCGEIHANLMDLGYCVQPDDDMNALLAEYRDLHDTSAMAA